MAKQRIGVEEEIQRRINEAMQVQPVERAWHEVDIREALQNVVRLDEERLERQRNRKPQVWLSMRVIEDAGLTMVSRDGKGYFQRADGSLLTDAEALEWMSRNGIIY
jgi:hypothetical protein